MAIILKFNKTHLYEFSTSVTAPAAKVTLPLSPSSQFELILELQRLRSRLLLLVIDHEIRIMRLGPEF